MLGGTAVLVTASSWFSDAVSVLLHLGELVGILIVFCLVGILAIALVSWVFNEVARHVLKQARLTVHEQRGTGVPALFAFVGAVGVASSNVILTPTAAYVLTVAVALVTFVSACLAQDSRRGAARWVGIAGLVIPFLVVAIASVTSSDFAHLTAEEKVFLGGGIALGVTGVLVALVTLRDEYEPSL